MVLLTVQVKYVLVILHADNEGEGGTFSTYSLLSRYVRIGLPHKDVSIVLTSDARPISRNVTLARLL